MSYYFYHYINESMQWTTWKTQLKKGKWVYKNTHSSSCFNITAASLFGLDSFSAYGREMYVMLVIGYCFLKIPLCIKIHILVVSVTYQITPDISYFIHQKGSFLLDHLKITAITVRLCIKRFLLHWYQPCCIFFCLKES